MITTERTPLHIQYCPALEHSISLSVQTQYIIIRTSTVYHYPYKHRHIRLNCTRQDLIKPICLHSNRSILPFGLPRPLIQPGRTIKSRKIIPHNSRRYTMLWTACSNIAGSMCTTCRQSTDWVFVHQASTMPPTSRRHLAHTQNP